MIKSIPYESDKLYMSIYSQILYNISVSHTHIICVTYTYIKFIYCVTVNFRYLLFRSLILPSPLSSVSSDRLLDYKLVSGITSLPHSVHSRLPFTRTVSLNVHVSGTPSHHERHLTHSTRTRLPVQEHVYSGGVPPVHWYRQGPWYPSVLRPVTYSPPREGTYSTENI